MRARWRSSELYSISSQEASGSCSRWRWLPASRAENCLSGSWYRRRFVTCGRSSERILQATPDRLRFRDLKAIAERIARPPVSSTPEEFWRCYEALEASRVQGRGGQIITDLVSLIRHTLRPSEPLTPFATVVQQRYAAWRKQQADAGVIFTPEQEAWLDKIAEHIATSLTIEIEDFHDGWFAQRGNLGKAHELFGDRLQDIINDMNRALTA